MKKVMFVVSSLLICLLFLDGSNAYGTLSYEKALQCNQEEKDSVVLLGIPENSLFVVRDTLNLYGRDITLPKSVTLVFEGGLIYGGRLIGNNTKIECDSLAIFDNVKIDGSWNVPNISTSMFANLDYENSLRDVIALTNPKVNNTVIINKGDYLVTAMTNRDICLSIGSNTTLVMDGTIQMTPNNFPRYDIFRVNGNNILITGKGAIVGDKNNHTGSEGEWGMGIRFHNATNACVEHITIRDCWGDCIYVGANSKNVSIEDCVLDNGRRQGISITKADSVAIRNCVISNVAGTKPEYAIDIEPNQGDTISNVLVENVDIRNCIGGILVTKGGVEDRGKNALIKKVEIKNCSLSGINTYPVRIRRCDYAIVEGCSVISKNSYPSIYAAEVGNIAIMNNFISFSIDVVNEKDRNKYKSISVSKCGLEMITNNSFIERL